MTSKSFKIIRLLLFLITLITINGALLFHISMNYSKIKVFLIGDERVVVPYKEEYKDQGFMIIYDKLEIDVTDSVYDVVSNIDTSKIGEYEVKYTVNYLNKNYTLKRVVEVKDTVLPTIKANVDKIEISPCNNGLTTFNYSAVDDIDGDITDKIVKEELDDKVILKVSDSSNNETTLEVPIIKVEASSNKVILNGNTTISLGLGSKYTEQGAYYSDGCGNKIDDKIEISGTVNTNVIGTYTITYTSKTDNKYKTTRTVNVKEMPKRQTAPTTGNSVIYLTFDDGPGAYTQGILDTLDKYNIKATFFVTNQFPRYQGMIAEEARRGHTIGVHTYSHQWSIYHSLDNYWNDFNAMNNIIEQQTGKKATILRFPGGTSNQVSKVGMSNVVNSVNNSGYKYYDWNVCVEDAGACIKSKNKEACVYSYYTYQLKPGRDNIVLMHDIKSYTANKLEDMIKYGLDNGYTFRAIDDQTFEEHFKPYK